MARAASARALRLSVHDGLLLAHDAYDEEHDDAAARPCARRQSHHYLAVEPDGAPAP